MRILIAEDETIIRLDLRELLEKADVLGGTTAVSSGVAWLPANCHQAAHGVSDSRAEALAYLESLSHGFDSVIC